MPADDFISSDQAPAPSEKHVFILLGRWLRLHHRWQDRLPELAVILAQPEPAAEADPAIRQQHAHASAEIQTIREQARAWGSALEQELKSVHPAYQQFAAAFRSCHAAYEPWIARLVPPSCLPVEQLAPALQHAAESAQSLNLGIRLRLGVVHPVPEQKGTGFSVACCFLGGIVLSVVFFNPLPFLLGIGLAMLAASLGDKVSGHAEAVALQKQFKDLIDDA